MIGVMRRIECDVTGQLVLLDDGHRPRGYVLADAAAWLEANDVDQVAAEDALVDHPGLVGRAWWSDGGGPDGGTFCSAPNDDNGHQAPRAVTVVHVQMHADHVPPAPGSAPLTVHGPVDIPMMVDPIDDRLMP